MMLQKDIENDWSIAHARAICTHPAWIEIDTKQFRKNLNAIRKIIGQRLLCLPVKANAYGHGLYPMGKIAEESGADYLGVSCLKEAVELRLRGISIPIVIFGAIHEDQVDDLIKLDLDFTISSKYKAGLIAKKIGHMSRKCRVHIEVDTGMQRTGVRAANALALFSFVESIGCFDVVGIYSHLATSDRPKDSFTLEQIKVFRSLVNQLQGRKLLCHLANSGGVVHYPDSYFDMVRPGLLAYGYYPDGKVDPTQEIAPCLSLKAKVSYFKVVQKGEGISYGHHYRTQGETRIVTIPVGYGDGYRRNLYKRATVLIRNEHFPIAGTICMDQFMVDIGKKEAFVGDEVVLIGRQGEQEISLPNLACYADSIPYEILTGFNDRLPRLYV